MTHYQILFLDIDGTILRPDHTIEESTKRAIAEVQDKGIEVVLSTGRPLYDILDTGKELNIDSYISYNGAYARYKGKEIFKEYVDVKLVEEYIKIAEAENHEMILYAEEKTLLTKPDAEKTLAFLHHFGFTDKAKATKADYERILSMTVITNDQKVPTQYPLHSGVLLSQVNVEGMRHSFDVILDHVNKGVAVKAMLDHLEIPSENAIAFGDGMNDKEMIITVGEGFAMGNGHPDLFKYAKHITSDVSQSGVYNGLKKLGLVE